MCRWHTNKAPTGAAAETRGYRGGAPKKYAKPRKGREKQRSAFFRAMSSFSFISSDFLFLAQAAWPPISCRQEMGERTARGLAPSNPALCFLRQFAAPSPSARPAKFALTRKTGRLVGESPQISVGNNLGRFRGLGYGLAGSCARQSAPQLKIAANLPR